MTCSRTQSDQFLRCEMSDPERTRYEIHLDECETCRRWLDEATSIESATLHLQERLGRSREMPVWAPIASSHDDFPEVAFASDMSILSPSDDPQSLGRIGVFEARAIIGRGGMGTVYKAIDPSLGRTVAIKILRPELASIGSARRRFALEAKAMAAIAHPHVVPIHAVDEHQGVPYMAMEYVPGGNLESRLRTEGPLPLLSVLRITQQIAHALHAAHECGLVHRDIKPANILLDRGVDRVRVGDFGLVRVSDDATMTRSGVIAGTPLFMSPEQVLGKSCEPQSDLFSLGGVMYTLLTGHPPFRAESPYAAMQRIVHDTPRPIREFRPETPRWVQHFLDRLLEKAPARRFQSAADVAKVLEGELAYLQNPNRAEKPERAWVLRKPRSGTKLKRENFRIAMWTFAVAILALVAVPTAVYWKQLGDRQESRASTTVYVPERLPVSLWNKDGFQETARQVLRLSQPESVAPIDAHEDPWWSEALTLERSIQHIESTKP